MVERGNPAGKRGLSGMWEKEGYLLGVLPTHHGTPARYTYHGVHPSSQVHPACLPSVLRCYHHPTRSPLTALSLCVA